MTIREAIRAGISRIRLPNWNDASYLELDLVSGPQGTAGPWITLHDPCSQREGGPSKFLWFELDDDDEKGWEVASEVIVERVAAAEAQGEDWRDGA